MSGATCWSVRPRRADRSVTSPGPHSAPRRRPDACIHATDRRQPHARFSAEFPAALIKWCARSRPRTIRPWPVGAPASPSHDASPCRTPRDFAPRASTMKTAWLMDTVGNQHARNRNRRHQVRHSQHPPEDRRPSDSGTRRRRGIRRLPPRLHVCGAAHRAARRWPRRGAQAICGPQGAATPARATRRCTRVGMSSASDPGGGTARPTGWSWRPSAGGPKVRVCAQTSTVPV